MTTLTSLPASPPDAIVTARQLHDLRQLLAQQRRESGLVRHQRMQKHELIEGLLQRQHLVRLQTMLRRLSPEEAATVIAALDDDDRLLALRQVDEQVCDRILELLPDSLREELVAARPQPAVGNMLNVFVLREGRLTQVPVATKSDFLRIKPVWVDLVAPTPGLRAWVGDYFGIALPDPDDSADIKVSARFFVEDSGDLHLHSDFLADAGGASRNVAVAFVLHREVLFSVRDEELPVFRLQRLRARTQAGYVDEGNDVLLDLLAANVEYSADSLERIYRDFEAMGRRVLDPKGSDDEAARTLAAITRGEDINGRIRRNVLDTRRALSFLLRSKRLADEQRDYLRQIMRDIESLDTHTTFISGKINFLMDSTIGFISVSQNRRVAKLAGIGVVITPISIAAGIGGMSEYSRMTRDIPWQWAYGGFVFGVIAFGFALYGGLRYFERRQAAADQATAG